MATGTITQPGGSGGLSPTSALLMVQALEGSVVSISKSSDTKTATPRENANAPAVNDNYFLIPASQLDSNPWTVSAAYGGYTQTSTIVIDAAKDYSILFPDAFLFNPDFGGALVNFGINNNGSVVHTTIGTTAINSYTSDMTKQGSIYTAETIDMSKFKTLHAIVKCTRNISSAPYNLRMLVAATQPPGDSANPTGVGMVRFSANSTATEYTIDLSSISGNYYVGIWGVGDWELTKWWLTVDA